MGWEQTPGSEQVLRQLDAVLGSASVFYGDRSTVDPEGAVERASGGVGQPRIPDVLGCHSAAVTPE